MSKAYLERQRIENSPSDKYRYEYKVECRVCTTIYWTRTYYTEQPRCKRCAGRQTYTPAKVERKNIRRRGDGYITKQGYHLIFDGAQYIPAHRLAFPDLPKDMVVHHIDGDKLNNVESNLTPLTKKRHREAHGSLEQASYLLVQAGLIKYDRGNNLYSLDDSMTELMARLSISSLERSIDSVDVKLSGRSNDFPAEEYARDLIKSKNTVIPVNAN